MIYAVDFGNYSVKTSTFNRIPSKIAYTSKLKRNKRVLNLDNQTYYLGEGEYTTDWNKAQKETLLPLLFGALAEENQTVYQLVLGLPVGQYKANRDSLRNYILQNKYKDITYNNRSKKIIIDDVIVAAEGVTVFHNIPDNIKIEIGNRDIVVVDIGGGSTDISLLKGNSKEREVEDYSTIPTAMFKIYRDLIKAINERFTQNFRLEDAEDILNEGLFLYGQNQDLSFVVPIIKNHFNSILQEINLIAKADSGFIYLTGGGALMLKKPFQNRFKNLILSNNPLYDNVCGYLKEGENQWGSL